MSNPKTNVDIVSKLRDYEALVDKYTKTTPKMRKTQKSKDKQLAEIQRIMIDLKEKIREDPNPSTLKGYDDLIDKLDRYEQSDKFKIAYEGKIVPKHGLEKFSKRTALPPLPPPPPLEKQEEKKEEAKEDTRDIGEYVDPDTERLMRMIGGEEPIDEEFWEEQRDKERHMVGEEETKEEVKEETKEEVKEEVKEEAKEERGEEDSSGVSPEMEEFRNQIRRGERERVIAEDTEGKIDIPKERLGIEGKSIKGLNEDIKYFLKRFPDMLKLERDVYNKADKKNRKLLVDIHRRIQAKLSPKAEETTKRIGIILDADTYIDDKINEILARKTLEGLTPASLVDITSEPKSKGKDVGSYTLTQVGGRDVVEHAPVYRAIPSTSDEALKKPSDKKARIDQSTIYKNSGKTKVDIAKMELVDNPFIRRTRPDRFNIIL